MVIFFLRLLKKYSFPFFLTSFVISFFVPRLYKDIINIEFSILAPLVVILHYKFKSIAQSAQVVFIIFTACTVIFGVPGSALGYLLSAASGLFVSQRVLGNADDCGNTIDFRFFAVTAAIFIFASIYLLYANIRNAFSIELILDYFGIASINYASLTVASFCSIFSVWCVRRQFAGSYFTRHQIIILRVLSGILGITIFGLCVIFTTRSAILGCLPPLLYALQPKRPYLYLCGLLVGCNAVYLLFPDFAEAVLSLMVPGRDSLSDLYESELKGEERSQAALYIFEKAIPKFSFCIDCSHYLSYSGLSNLIALSFPFSIFYVFQLISFFVRYAVFLFLPININPLLFLIILISFLNSLLLTTFQADFLSMVSLFFVVGHGLSVLKKSNPLQSSRINFQ